jgi:molybdopterin/thiamine biosynthesis adenylyltransferase
VALNLCRLGVKKIYLLDKDVVDHHNLNRQVLFSKDHIGKSKVNIRVLVTIFHF